MSRVNPARWLFGLLALSTAVAGSAAAETPTAKAILARADDTRFPGGDSRIEATVVSIRPGGHREEAAYEVLLKGRDKTLIKTLSPATDRGTSILMLGHDLWVFLPDVSKPVRVSLQQRLLGEVSNGDLARANFVGDYTPRLLESKAKYYLLDLVAKNDSTTYGRVKLWVDRSTFLPIRAAFYAASGRLLKVGSYENYTKMADALRPTRLVFTDAVERGKQSTILYREIQPQSFPEKYFTKDYLKKLKY
jgi:outer membrane lipoprotein-sorting protein